jgi:hypothetical protein
MYADRRAVVVAVSQCDERKSGARSGIKGGRRLRSGRDRRV